MRSRQRVKFDNLKILLNTRKSAHKKKEKLTLVNEYIKTLEYLTAQETIQK